MKVKIMDDNAFKHRIMMNIVNSLLAGALVFAGSFSSGGISWEGFCLAGVTSIIVMITKFKDFWNKEMNKKGAQQFLFNFM